MQHILHTFGSKVLLTNTKKTEYLKNDDEQGCSNQLENVRGDSPQASSKLHSKRGLSLDCDEIYVSNDLHSGLLLGESSDNRDNCSFVEIWMNEKLNTRGTTSWHTPCLLYQVSMISFFNCDTNSFNGLPCKYGS